MGTEKTTALIASKTNLNTDQITQSNISTDAKIAKSEDRMKTEIIANTLILDAKIDDTQKDLEKITESKKYVGQYLTCTSTGTKWDYLTNDTQDSVVNEINVSFGKQALSRTNGYLVTPLSNDYCRRMLVLNDGKFLLAGDSNGTISLIRLTTSGTLDTTFGIDNTGITNINLSKIPSDVVINLALQSDGKILLCGETDKKHFLARFTADGIIDKTFGVDKTGYIIGGLNILSTPSTNTPSTNISTSTSKPTTSIGRNVTVLADDKILLCGEIYGQIYGYFLAKYDKDGLLDPTFGPNSTGYIYDNNSFGALTLLFNENKIYLAGNLLENPAIMSFNMDGTINTTFANNGIFSTNNTTTNIKGTIREIKLTSDKKIVACGYSYVGLNTSYNQNLFVAKLDINGQLDNTFGADKTGYILTDLSSLGTNEYIWNLDIDASNRILIGGNIQRTSSGQDFLVARYNSNGLLDTTFALDGYLIRDFNNKNDQVRSIKVLSDGKIMIAGYATFNSTIYGTIYPNINFVLSRYNSNGQIDTTFGTSGISTIEVTKTNNFINIDRCYDNKILISGNLNLNFSLFKYNNDFTIDNTFGSNGLIINDFGNREAVNDSAIRNNNYFLLGTSNSINIILAKYNLDGNLDTSFGGSLNQGFISKSVGTANVGTSFGFLSDNSIIIGGICDDFCTLIKYSKEGIIDNKFGTNGVLTTPFNARISQESATTLGITSSPLPLYEFKLIVLDDDSIIFVTTSNDKITVVKYLSTGILDKSFGSNGLLVFNKISNIHVIRRIKILPDGKILISGFVDNKLILIKFDRFGILDKSFGTNGITMTTLTPAFAINPSYGYSVYFSNTLSVTIQNDDKVVLCGYIRLEDGTYISFLARYNNGILDNTFGSELNGFNLFPVYNGSNVFFRSVTIHYDGRIIVLANISSTIVIFSFEPDGKTTNNFGNIQGISNTALGNFALNQNISGSYNTASGQNSLYSNKTGSYNTASGQGSLFSNTTGSYNTASGYGSLRSNTGGNSNTASGFESLYSNTTGGGNTASGYASLRSNTRGSYNTTSGQGSLFSNTIGSNNTASGYDSLVSNTEGGSNTAFGYESLKSNTTGVSNTAIGKSAFASGANYSNSTAIGFNAQVTSSNQVQIGDTNINLVNTSGKVKSSKGFVLPRFTQPERDALVDKEVGQMVMGSDNKLYIYIGGGIGEGWKSVELR
jgi:uncharacterized delta-60 repeat protein